MEIGLHATETTDNQVLTFSVQDALFCVDLQSIERVLPLVALQSVPLSPNFVKGLMVIQGENMPVIDLAERLSLTMGRPYNLNMPILLCQSSTKKVGIVVSTIVGVETLISKPDELDQMFEHAESPFTSVVPTRRGQSLLLDLELVFDFELYDGHDNSL
jgi:chemotaxis signal transduction protein